MQNRVVEQHTVTQDAETRPSPNFWRRAWPHLLVAALYTLIMFFYLDVVLGFSLAYVPYESATWLFGWDLWWIKKALLDLHTNPFFTTYINAPGGASLNFQTFIFLDGLLAIPFQLAGMNIVGVFNLLTLFGYIGSAYAMFVLADHFVHNKRAAFVAGLVFGFSPQHFAHFTAGNLNFISLQWVPIYVLFMLKIGDAPTVRRRWLYIVLAAVFLALNALTEWTLALFLVMLTVLYGVYLLWQGRRTWRAVLRGPIVHLAAVGVLFGVLTSPVLVPMLNEARTQSYLSTYANGAIYNSADLLSFVLPDLQHPYLGAPVSQIAANLTGAPAERTVYLGLIALALAVLGLWHFRKRPRPSGYGFWVLSAATFAVLALGPRLHVNDITTFTPLHVPVPMPYVLLYHLPIFSIMRAPDRFDLIVMLAVAMLAAYGVVALEARLKTRPSVSYVIVAVLSAIIVFEYAPNAIPDSLPISPVYSIIAQDTDASHAVLELPWVPDTYYYKTQLVHNKPIALGIIARQVDNPLVDTNPALKVLALHGDDPAAQESQLRESGFHYLVVNWWVMSDAEKAGTQAALQRLINRPPDAESTEPNGRRVSLYIIR